MRRMMMMTLLLPALLLSACGGSAQNVAATQPTAAPATEVPATVVPTVPRATATAKPTAVPPTATPPPAQELELVAVGFSQEGQAVGYGFELLNPNAAYAFEGVSLQIVAFGSGDVVLGSDDERLSLVAPDATLYIGGDIYLSVDQPVERVSVQLISSGTALNFTADRLPLFPVEAISVRESLLGQRVSGVVRSPYIVPWTNLSVGIVGYDEAGEIVGGGFTFLDFLLPEGTSPFDAAVKFSAAPARIEVTPLLTSLSLLGKREPADIPPLSVVEDAWWAERTQIGYAVIVENPDAAQGMEGAQYQIGVYAEDGSVLATKSGYFGLILPGGQGVSADALYVTDSSPAPARVDVQILPGRLVAADGKLDYVAEGLSFMRGMFNAQVTGQFNNPYSQPVNNVGLTVLLRASDGSMIGGGSGFSSMVPAGGKAAFDVTVTSSGEPATIELFAYEVSITSFGSR